MYSIYTTEGWVLGGLNIGESNRYIDLFTRDLGLIRGIAQSVRKLESKLRYGLQDLAYSKLSLVKGREVWRIVNVEKLESFELLTGDKKNKEIVSRVFSLIKRLVKGEEKDATLFDDVKSAISLISGEALSAEELKNLETVLVYRILHKLGYIPESASLKSVSEFTTWDSLSIEINAIQRSAMVRQINDSLLHSHL